jgi:RNA polymerase sigma factor (sigma-70 family)
LTPVDEFEAFCNQAALDSLTARLRLAFPRLESEAEDLVQEALLQTLDKVRKEPFQPEKGWRAWLYAVAKNRALDRLRRVELKLFEDLSTRNASTSGQGWQPADNRVSPSERAAEKERRTRQGKMLSDILQEWCRHCETSSEGLMHKEFFERLLRGQDYEVIKAVLDEHMGKKGKGGISKNTLYQWRNRAHQWILDRVRQTDVNRSVFQTMLRPSNEKNSAVVSRSAPLLRKGKRSRGAVEASNHPPQPPRQPPNVTRFGDVVLWVIEEAGALCPSPERLERYSSQRSLTEFPDVQYHVEEANCQLCQASFDIDCSST